MEPPSAIALFLLTAAYAIVLVLTVPARIGDALMVGVANVLPSAALSAAIWSDPRSWICPRMRGLRAITPASPLTTRLRRLRSTP